MRSRQRLHSRRSERARPPDLVPEQAAHFRLRAPSEAGGRNAGGVDGLNGHICVKEDARLRTLPTVPEGENVTWSVSVWLGASRERRIRTKSAGFSTQRLKNEKLSSGRLLRVKHTPFAAEETVRPTVCFSACSATVAPVVSGVATKTRVSPCRRSEAHVSAEHLLHPESNEVQRRHYHQAGQRSSCRHLVWHVRRDESHD